jgi:hypothetical protein
VTIKPKTEKENADAEIRVLFPELKAILFLLKRITNATRKKLVQEK